MRYVYNDLKSFNKKILVKVNGNYAPVIGRICMYHTIVDLTNINATTGDEVVLDINPSTSQRKLNVSMFNVILYV